MAKAAMTVDEYVGRTFQSRDPRDDGRRIRIVDFADGKLHYRRLEPSSVSPTTLVPNGRNGTIAIKTLRKSWTDVS